VVATALWNLSGSPACRLRLVEEGVGRALVRLLLDSSAHPGGGGRGGVGNSQRTYRACCFCLANLFCDPGYHKDGAHVGRDVIPALVALSEQPDALTVRWR
jgi:hypothetical protein